MGEKKTLLNNILRRKVYWIGHILKRNCLLHDATEVQIMDVKRVTRGPQLLDDFRNSRRYWDSLHYVRTFHLLGFLAEAFR